jgi:hypothetical protein
VDIAKLKGPFVVLFTATFALIVTGGGGGGGGGLLSILPAPQAERNASRKTIEPSARVFMWCLPL